LKEHQAERLCIAIKCHLYSLQIINLFRPLGRRVHLASSFLSWSPSSPAAFFDTHAKAGLSVSGKRMEPMVEAGDVGDAGPAETKEPARERSPRGGQVIRKHSNGASENRNARGDLAAPV